MRLVKRVFKAIFVLVLFVFRICPLQMMVFHRSLKRVFASHVVAARLKAHLNAKKALIYGLEFVQSVAGLI